MDLSKHLLTSDSCPEPGRSGMVMHSSAMKQVLRLCEKIASYDSTVLLQGETGTGKSALAGLIHGMSRRSRQPFLTINCASIPENLLEAELFGYSPGAFTGALKQGKIGLIEAAHQGTLFLDEIGEMPLHMQAKLLHVIQDQEFLPLGQVESKKVDVRIIAATNCNLQKMVQQKKFREDLYYRLHVIDLKVPPLRERMDDIEPLVAHFIRKHNERLGGSHRVAPDALQLLKRYRWPGNIRQLENVLEKLIITTDGLITAADLPDEIRLGASAAQPPSPLPSLSVALEELEKQLISQSYDRFKSSRKVAEYLKISQSKASRLIRKYCDVIADEA
ncbi:sigma-54 interaction domain-containing protein [Brevibacillus fluminis]|uniref:sigma-54 interaction domain-containing protein n=1 Tax=Brevibacillus fluminis TaxID=511487 RepID=UPI003F8A3B63